MNLPQEVLLFILQSFIQDQPILSTHDIFHCQLVCKRWKSTAQCTNYTRLTLQILLFYENDITLLNKLHQFHKLQQLVVKRRTNSIQSLDSILDQLPNLTKLDVVLYHTISFSTDSLIGDDDISLNSTLKLLDGLFVVHDSTYVTLCINFLNCKNYTLTMLDQKKKER